MPYASSSRQPPPSFVTLDGVGPQRGGSPYVARSLPPAFSDVVLSTRSMRPASTNNHGPAYQARDPFHRRARRHQRVEQLTFDDIPTGETRPDDYLTPHHTRGSLVPQPAPQPVSQSDDPYRPRPASSVGNESARIPFQAPPHGRSNTLESSYPVREGKRPAAPSQRSSEHLPPAYSTDNLSQIGYSEESYPYPPEKAQPEAGPSNPRRSCDTHETRPEYYPPAPTASTHSITPPSYYPHAEYRRSTGDISLPHSEIGTFGARRPSFLSQIITFILCIPSQIYLNFLLRLPSLYFSRVARIFEEADMTLPEIKKMAFETAFRGKLADSNSVQRALEYAMPMPGRGTGKGDAPGIPVAYECLKASWEFFIDSLMREWKTFNIISVLLLSAILTILQIEEAAADPITRYAALHSLICALVSLLFGCIYIIRFGTMRKTYKAAEWALEAQKSSTMIWWNVWILLAMPAIWLAWSLMMYIVCIMTFIWRTGNGAVVPELPSSAILACKIFISSTLGLGIVYGTLIIYTFRRYGQSMDRRWKQRIDEWIGEMRENAAALNGAEQGMDMMGTGMPVGYPYFHHHHAQYTGPTASAMSMGMTQQSRRASYHSAFVAGRGPVPAPLLRTHAFEGENMHEEGRDESIGTPPQITVQPTSTASQPSMSEHDDSVRIVVHNDSHEDRNTVGFGLPRSASPMAIQEHEDARDVLVSEIPPLTGSRPNEIDVVERSESPSIEYADDHTYPTEAQPANAPSPSSSSAHTESGTSLPSNLSTPPPALLSPISPSFDKSPILCTPLEPVKVVNMIQALASPSSSSANPGQHPQQGSTSTSTFGPLSNVHRIAASTSQHHRRLPSSTSSPFNPFRTHQARTANVEETRGTIELEPRQINRNPWRDAAGAQTTTNQLGAASNSGMNVAGVDLNPDSGQEGSSKNNV